MLSLVLIGFVVILIFVVVQFKDENPKVVVVLQELNTDHSKIVKSGIEKGFEDMDLDGKVVAPDSQYPASKQVTILKDILKEKPNALIVTPTELSACIPVLEEYKKRNIPVLMLNEGIEWQDQTTFIGTDHLQLGKLAGALLSSALQPGNQVVFIFNKQPNEVERVWIKEAKKAMDNSGIEVIEVHQEYDESGKVKSVMGNVLQTYPDIKGLFVTNEKTAIDALNVVEEQGLNISVIGTHGSMGMIHAVEEDVLGAIAAQNPYDMGYLSVEQALKVIQGEHVAKRIDSGISIITADNAQSVADFYAKKVFNEGSKTIKLLR
jgi:ribose transport system substrate-binding protein